MTWKLFFMTASIAMFFLTFGVGLARPMSLASAIAPRLAAELDADEREVMSHLQTILLEDSVWRALVESAPWALLSVILIGRVVADLAGDFLSGWRGEDKGPAKE